MIAVFVFVDVIRALRKLFDLLLSALRGEKDEGLGKNDGKKTMKNN